MASADANSDKPNNINEDIKDNADTDIPSNAGLAVADNNPNSIPNNINESNKNKPVKGTISQKEKSVPSPTPPLKTKTESTLADIQCQLKQLADFQQQIIKQPL